MRPWTRRAHAGKEEGSKTHKAGALSKVTVVVVPPYVELSFFSRGTSKEKKRRGVARCHFFKDQVVTDPS
jgi:hypothetical protein